MGIITDSRGYVYLVDPSKPEATADRIAIHRIIAYAHGELDSVHSEMQIDHLNTVKWDNRPENLEAVTPSKHGRITRQRAQSDD